MLSINDINLLQAQNEGLRKQNEDLQKENKHLKDLYNQALKDYEQIQEEENKKIKQEFDLFKSNEDMLISALQLLWGKQIAEEQGDCKNIDYRKPKTTNIYNKISEFQETLKDVAFAQSVSIGKTKPLGDTGSPKSYKRWEKKQRELIAKEIKWD